MSEDTQSIRIDPNEELTDEKKLILLKQWGDKVQEDVDVYNAEKEIILTSYKKKKEKFDRILAVKIKKMKKYDSLLSNRKKVLADVNKEIDNLLASINQPPIS
jgi:hypothetical protein